MKNKLSKLVKSNKVKFIELSELDKRTVSLLRECSLRYKEVLRRGKAFRDTCDKRYRYQ